ncbi:6-phosphogluconolactonase [Acetobacteraceae bacterium KSS8]|uniref:6-phosphogluconolactonase n=2 Tax=Endosaccharibacter trunci TaxID=2812733 RepID=A0ABT1W411_9PROT|nr:6-phosphogluconolactonase [Acetobacteraceae bacterium KSS8]
MPTDAPNGRVDIATDAEAVAQRAASLIAEKVRGSSGPFVIALSGGSTPKRLYQILASDYADLPWDRMQLVFGDERFVPADDSSSNYRMVSEALLSKVDVPSANVHPMPTDGTPADAALRYQGILQRIHGSDTLQPGKPLFDIVLLGLGENGHTASLFPGTDVLNERKAWVGSCTPLDAPHDRLTLTYPAIQSSRLVMFLVAGAGKAEIVAKVRGGDAAQPSTQIRTDGELLWLLDKAAAGERDHAG